MTRPDFWNGVMIGISGMTLLTAIGMAVAPDGPTKEQLDKAYKQGIADALDTSRPHERLEYVCAALWFKGQANDNR